MIHEILLRWVVIGLFALAALEYGLAVVTKPRPWTSTLNHALHVVMAAAMVVMAWPWAVRLPTTEPALFFMLAAVSFVVMAVFVVRAPGLRASYAYHGLMMLSTAWMYLVMNTRLMPAPPIAQAGMSMPGMDMPEPHQSPVWFSVVGWLGAVSFAAATVLWTCRYVIDRHRKTTPRRRALGELGQAMMAAGMAIFFLATIVWI